ncbi:hypothetical protein DCAR_0522154 [Daucus carota subsp. sativus]|uniref:No apical meristem-associated C-terminal domain-containing protein n=1 Tax=Daucus carota subsp. sativus TaxID=79200 RepID=A0A164ZM63_DAUCS|nr:hypothetical protein DCAR_0522154 [Daucus carota subsp. sativus]
MEGSFISLLEEGSIPEIEDMMFSQPTQSQSQPQTQNQPQLQKEALKLKKGKRSKNFLIQEDMLLLSAWLNNQTHTNYWARIWKYYKENKKKARE